MKLQHSIGRGRQWMAALAVALAATGATAGAPSSPAQPAAGSGDGAGVTVQRNVYTAGGQVRPRGPVRGDFAAAGGRVILDQSVGGDAALMGGSVDVRAPVGDDVRVAAGDISIESNVGGELFATGGNIALTRAASVGGAASLYGGNVTLEGRVDGPLTAHAQKILINGEVRGDVRLAGGDIELGPLARLGGALSYAGASELKRAEGATVAGAVSRQEGAPASRQAARAERGRGGEGDWGASRGPSIVGGVFSLLGLLACAAALLLVAPTFAIHTSQRIRSTPWLALAIGFAAVLAVPVLAVLLFLTLLGIPLGLVLIALYPVLLLAGFVVGVLFIARLIPSALGQPAPGSYGRNMAYVTLALVLLLLVGAVPVVGGLLIAAVSLAGMGACVLEMYGRRRGTGGSAPHEHQQQVVGGQGVPLSQ